MERIKAFKYVLVGLGILLLAGVTYAAFVDKGNVLGATFSVGSTDLKLLYNVAGGVDTGNLVDTKEGPAFENMFPGWTRDYLVKLYNNATTAVAITSNANYETVNDPQELRQLIFVEPFEWNDTNANGVVDDGELGASFGQKTIVKWKTEGYSFGNLGMGQVKALVLRFSAPTISDTKQGAQAVMDFEFNATGVE